MSRAARERERLGRHLSVGGAAADDVLDGLVRQFADRYTFVRELIQNSLDAGAARIEVRMAWADGELRVEVQDDGEGMDRAIVEGYLLTLFRSTKEEDLTKIGKFGIGFTSIFAMDPREVVVDTGRDGVWHRVTFDATRAYTLSRLPDPYEGTTVTLRLPRSRAAASDDVVRIDAAAKRWCRYADAAIRTSAVGTAETWEPRPIADPLGVDAPVCVREERDGLVAVLGPHPSEKPPVGFYNRGITLWEAEDGELPGVTFRAMGRHLEHTLTRDNVRRDRHYAAVLASLRACAETKLADAVHSEAEAAARAGDLPRARRLFAAIAPRVPWAWREDAPLLPGLGEPLSLGALRRGRTLAERLRGAAPTVWWATPGCPLGSAVARTGVAVVSAETEGEPYLAWAAGAAGGGRRAVRDAWILAERADPGDAAALFAAACELAERDGATLGPGRFLGGGLEHRLAVCVPDGDGVRPAPLPAPRRSDPLLVHSEHPVVRALLALPVPVAAPLLVHAARADAHGSVGPAPGVADAVAIAMARPHGAS